MPWWTVPRAVPRPSSPGRVPARTLSSAIPMLAVLLCTGCPGTSNSTSSPPPTCTVSGVTVSASPATMNTGATTTLTAALNASAACTGGVTWAATPSGGTLTPNGLSASFTANAAGAYTVAATSTADPTKSGSAVVTVTSPAVACGSANGTVVTHSSNISADETWAGAGVTHRVPNDITINGNAVVTIQPCAIVALGPGHTINVGGTAHLVAAGTSSTNFVTFTRDVAGQAWGTLRGVSATSLIDLTWTTLVGGGNSSGFLGNASIAAIGNGYFVAPAAVLHVNNVTIQGSQGVGVYLDGNAAFTANSQLLTITGSGGRPVNLQMMALGSVPAGSYTGNATDEILIFGPSANVFADMTVADPGVPVRIPYGGLVVAPPAGGSTAPVTLTLKPGVVFKFPKVGGGPGARVVFGTNGNDPNNLVGVLNAIGTAARPIVFTSGEILPAPGDWVGIWLNTANGSRLDYVEISYAGAPSGIVSASCRPVNTPDNAALLVGDFSSQYVPPSNLITNSRITNSAGYGINAMWQAPAFNAPDLTASNTFANNARCRQTYNGVTPPGTCPVGGGCTVP